MNKNIAALMGNGVSIAHNKKLLLSRINTDLRAQFARDAVHGDEAVRTLDKIAKGMTHEDSKSDFEALVGPLDNLQNMMTLLGQYADFADPGGPYKAALTMSAQFADQVQRNGRSYALETIAGRSVATWGYGVVPDFIDDVVAAAGTGRLGIGNLNYDLLVMAALTARYRSQFCDMTDPTSGYWTHPVVPGYPLDGMPLRTSPDFPVGRQIRLLHLHGSLTWLQDPVTGAVWRFHIEDIRDANYFAAYRDYATEWVPKVVLTNQDHKADAVAEAPFDLAYDSFKHELETSDRWLIAGYSFRDGCVNDLLAEVWRARKTYPDIMVVTHGDDLSERMVLDAIGWEKWLGPDVRDHLTIVRTGITGIRGNAGWDRWAAAGTGAVRWTA